MHRPSRLAKKKFERPLSGTVVEPVDDRDGRKAEWPALAESGPAAFGAHVTEVDVQIGRQAFCLGLLIGCGTASCRATVARTSFRSRSVSQASACR